MCAGSLPASGSVCANAAVFSPRSTGSRYLSFCSGRRLRRIDITEGPKMLGPRGGIATGRAISSQIAASASRLRSWPPYSFGVSSSHRPISRVFPSSAARISGRRSGPSIACISIGMSSRSTKRRSVSFRSRTSSGSSNSISDCLRGAQGRDFRFREPCFAQHLVGVLAILRSGYGEAGGRAAQSERLAEERDVAELLRAYRLSDADVLHLRIGEGLVDLVDRAAGNARLVHLLHQRF